jgi:uncharacterized damage-inducible protein DinB
MTHPLVAQLRFARSEFVRCLEGVSDEDARHRIMPMNCISWMVGHMAAQEQEYFAFFPNGSVPHPQLNVSHGYGQPATTPPLAEMWQVWQDITEAADIFLDTVTEDQLEINLEQDVGSVKEALFAYYQVNEDMLAQEKVRSRENIGTRILRVTYHYFFHTGEAHAVRQQLGHPDLPFFVGAMPDDLFIEGGAN